MICIKCVLHGVHHGTCWWARWTGPFLSLWFSSFYKCLAFSHGHWSNCFEEPTALLNAVSTGKEEEMCALIDVGSGEYSVQNWRTPNFEFVTTRSSIPWSDDKLIPDQKDASNFWNQVAYVNNPLYLWKSVEMIKISRQISLKYFGSIY